MGRVNDRIERLLDKARPPAPPPPGPRMCHRCTPGIWAFVDQSMQKLLADVARRAGLVWPPGRCNECGQNTDGGRATFEAILAAMTEDESAAFKRALR